MSYLANQLGKSGDAQLYQKEFQKLKSSLLKTLFFQDDQQAYFKTEAGKDQIDTVASILGALYLLSVEDAVKVENTLAKTVKRQTGLQNFHPPYEAKDIFLPFRVIGHQDYHNRFVWPWVTAQNIQVKIKIALEHHDFEVRERFQQEAVADFCQMVALFSELGSAYEVVEPDKIEVGKTPFYTSQKDFMASMVGFETTRKLLNKLGWIEER